MGDLFVIHDGLDAILLGAFFFGLIFSAISLLLGAVAVPGVHVGHGHGHLHGHSHAAHHGNHDSDISIFNLSTILAFVTWFGGCAYLLRNGFSLPGMVGIAGGMVGGLAGAVVVFRLLVLMKRQETYLDATREGLSGAIARVTMPIRAGGTGEIVYELNGVRQASAARSIDGSMLPRGSEVIVLKRERGIAFVEPSTELDPNGDWERRFAVANGRERSLGPPGEERGLTDHGSTQ